MVSEPLLWHFLSSLVFISVTPFFSTSLPPSQQPPQPFAVEPPTSFGCRPWVPNLQPPSLKSFTLHRPLLLASPLQTLLRLRFWSHHRDRLAPIYKTVKASTPSETARAPTRRSKFLYGWSRVPRAVTRLQAPPRARFLLLTSALGNVICWRHRWPDRWLWPLTFPHGWLFQSRFFLPSFSRRFHFCSLFLHIVSLNG